MNTTPTNITVYGRPMCAMLPQVRGLLRLGNIPYTYINIRQDEAARQRVREINQGNESVPTLVFADGTTLTEPSVTALRNRLRQLGYTVPLPVLDGLLQHNFLILLLLGIGLGAFFGADLTQGMAFGIAAAYLANLALTYFIGR